MTKILPVVALEDEIANRDNIHMTLQILDQMVHELMDATKHKHTIDKECGCTANVVVSEDVL